MEKIRMLMRCVKNVGMVFKTISKTIYENVAYGLRVNGITDKNEIEERVVTTIEQVALWDEVKDKLKKKAFELSGGQQRLCIAVLCN
jgi:phosphate transport system ATP-binding protein